MLARDVEGFNLTVGVFDFQFKDMVRSAEIRLNNFAPIAGYLGINRASRKLTDAIANMTSAMRIYIFKFISHNSEKSQERKSILRI